MKSGPDHCKTFQIAAEIKNRKFTPAWGRTKKDAENTAPEAANRAGDLKGNCHPSPTKFKSGPC